jgi:hypothetical protein
LRGNSAPLAADQAGRRATRRFTDRPPDQRNARPTATSPEDVLRFARAACAVTVQRLLLRPPSERLRSIRQREDPVAGSCHAWLAEPNPEQSVSHVAFAGDVRSVGKTAGLPRLTGLSVPRQGVAELRPPPTRFRPVARRAHREPGSALPDASSLYQTASAYRTAHVSLTLRTLSYLPHESGRTQERHRVRLATRTC